MGGGTGGIRYAILTRAESTPIFTCRGGTAQWVRDWCTDLRVLGLVRIQGRDLAFFLSFFY